jgi:hypothetical protein
VAWPDLCPPRQYKFHAGETQAEELMVDEVIVRLLPSGVLQSFPAQGQWSGQWKARGGIGEAIARDSRT